MIAFFRRLLAPPPPPAWPEEAPPWAQEILERLRAEPEEPAWVATLLDGATKTSRAQARLALKLDEVERKVEGGYTDVRNALANTQRQMPAEISTPDELLDALDALDEAIRSAGEGSAMADGLTAIGGRIASYLSQQGLTRHAPRGEPADGRRFKVVGTEHDPALPDGVITRVVRAAVTRGNTVVREGEVLINRSPS